MVIPVNGQVTYMAPLRFLSAAVVALALLATACGDGTATAAGDAESTPPESAATETTGNAGDATGAESDDAADGDAMTDESADDATNDMADDGADENGATESNADTGDPAPADATPSSLPPDEAAAAAEQNIPTLTVTDDARDIEVVSVFDGSVTTLRDSVTGDRPVLLWFWAPH